MAIAPDGPGSWSRCAAAASARACPAALGAALARPDRKVVGVCSDGAAMYSITALWTAAHHHIPVTYVMLSNARYRILKLNMVEYLGQRRRRAASSSAMDLTDPDAALRPHGRGDGRARAPRRAARRTWPRPCARGIATRRPVPGRRGHRGPRAAARADGGQHAGCQGGRRGACQDDPQRRRGAIDRAATVESAPCGEARSFCGVPGGVV